jgi:hypothetical protein
MKNTIIFIILLGLFACKQDPDPTEPPTGCGMTIDQFPLKVGNSWTYQVYEAFDAGVYPEVSRTKFYYEIVGFDLIGDDDTIYTVKTAQIELGDTLDFYFDTLIRKNHNILKPFIVRRWNENDYGFIPFPLDCNGTDTIQEFNESDTLYSRIYKETYAIKDTLINIKGKSYKAVKCLRYVKSKIFEFSYNYVNVFEWYYITPNIGIVEYERRGIPRYPSEGIFKLKIKLINYKIL